MKNGNKIDLLAIHTAININITTKTIHGSIDYIRLVVSVQLLALYCRSVPSKNSVSKVPHVSADIRDSTSIVAVV